MCVGCFVCFVCVDYYVVVCLVGLFAAFGDGCVAARGLCGVRGSVDLIGACVVFAACVLLAVARRCAWCVLRMLCSI